MKAARGMGKQRKQIKNRKGIVLNERLIEIHSERSNNGISISISGSVSVKNSNSSNNNNNTKKSLAYTLFKYASLLIC